jgi:hypothetical protein
MGLVCKEWQVVLTDESTWKHLALGRFPRLTSLLAALAQTAPQCYRDLYRDQLALEKPPPAPRIDASGTIDGRLKRFVFTVEFYKDNRTGGMRQPTLANVMRRETPPERMLAWPSWTGRAERVDGGDGHSYKLQLWEHDP